MPELALHFSVPFALAAPKLGLRRALLVSALALLPDLDALFRVHRSMSHSMIILIIIYLPVLLSVYKFRRGYFKFVLIGLLALLSHPVMDSFQTYTPLFYPFLDRSVWFRVEGWVLISGLSVRSEFQAAVRDAPTVFRPFEFMDALVFTSEGLSIFLMLLAPALIFNLKPSRPVDMGPVRFQFDHPQGQVAAASGPVEGLGADDVTVVLPTLNEEGGIGRIIDEVRAEGFENILVVDGYSSDRTVEIARSKGVEVVFQDGVGKAGAIRSAIELVSTPYMLVMDADCTYDPRDIRALLGHASNHDEVIGLRMDRGNIPLLHRVGNRIISLVFSLLIGKKIRDPCSGLYLLRTSMARRLELTSGGFDVEVEIAGQVASFGNIQEVPVRYRRRVGEGKLKTWREGFRIMAAVLRVAWLYNPIFIFSSLASLLIIPGGIILFEQLLLRYLYGAEAWSMGWSWLGLTLFMIGLQGLTVATISLMLKRMERRIIGRAGERS